MVTLVVTCKELRIAGKNLHCGDAFEASEKDAKVYVAVNKAKRGDDPSLHWPSVRHQSDLPLSPRQGEDPESGPSASVAGDDPPARAKRKYQRRDMIAGD